MHNKVYKIIFSLVMLALMPFGYKAGQRISLCALVNRLIIRCCYIFIPIIIGIIVGIKALHLDTNPKVLDVVAKHYFDEQYYVATYPDVQHSVINPYNHYATIGWQEGRNPSKFFDTTFYKNIYLQNNKYNLNPLQHYVRSKLSFNTIYINTGQLKKVEKLLDNPQYYIALVAVFRNEDRFLREWIEFYRLMGVEHFYLYNHLSTDNYQEVLAPYIKEGIVELYNVTSEPKNTIEWNQLQTSIYNNTARQTRDLVEWLIIVDTDEFLFPVKDKDLKTLLKKYDQYASLSVNWKMFGTANVKHIPDNKLLIETLTMSNESTDLHVKTIVKPRFVETIGNPHYAILKPGYAQVTESFEYFIGPFIPHESKNIVRINHYWSRDYDFFESTKLARVHIMTKNSKENANDMTAKEKNLKIKALIQNDQAISQKYDDSILRFVPALRERVLLAN